MSAVSVGEGGQVVDVLQHLAHRLEDDREARVLARHLEQLRAALALLPERRAASGVVARQQQGARRRLAEARREQRRAADLEGDQLFELVVLEQEQLGARRLGIRLGQPHDDAVVARHRRPVDAEPLADARRDRQRPRRVHRRAVGGVQHEPPVAELVAEPLDHQRRVGRHRAGAPASARATKRFRLSTAHWSSPASTQPIVDLPSLPPAASSPANAPIALPSSAGRPRPSPFQNGTRPGCPNAGETSTRSEVISSMRHEVAPSANTSPTRDS